MTKKTLKVAVTNEDIKRGTRKDGLSCPVALAFKRAHPKAREVSVNGLSITWRHDGEVWDWKTALMVWDWIRAYDDDGLVAPFAFEMSLDEVEAF